MRNKFFLFLLSCFLFLAKAFADTTSVAVDTAAKPFIPPDQGPLGIDANTGIVLYGAAILFAVLIIALWRRNIINRSQAQGKE